MIVAASKPESVGDLRRQGASALAGYQAAIRPAETMAMSLYAEWSVRLARLAVAIDEVGLERALVRIGATGIFFDLTFGACQRQVAAIQPPRQAERHHQLWLESIRLMTRASQVLAGAARWGQRPDLGLCREILTEALSVVRDLNAEAIRIEAALKA